MSWVEGCAGSARLRLLAEDAEVLATVADHPALIRLQLLAWLFDTPERAQACADRDLAQMTEGDVDAPELLPAVTLALPLVEVLRAAALLEQTVVDSLPPPAPRLEQVGDALGRVLPAAPWLARMEIRLLRPLWHRGRVRGTRLWVGMPEVGLGPSVEHVSWQAAHEATVAEVVSLARERAIRHSERGLEQLALTVLSERAERAGLRGAHLSWLGHFGALPSLGRQALDAPSVMLCESLLGADLSIT